MESKISQFENELRIERGGSNLSSGSGAPDKDADAYVRFLSTTGKEQIVIFFGHIRSGDKSTTLTINRQQAKQLSNFLTSIVGQ